MEAILSSTSLRVQGCDIGFLIKAWTDENEANDVL